MLIHPRVTELNGWWSASIQFFPGLEMGPIIFKGDTYPSQEAAIKMANEAAEKAEIAALDFN